MPNKALKRENDQRCANAQLLPVFFVSQQVREIRINYKEEHLHE